MQPVEPWPLPESEPLPTLAPINQHAPPRSPNHSRQPRTNPVVAPLIVGGILLALALLILLYVAFAAGVNQTGNP